jgi:hypothetical protein
MSPSVMTFPARNFKFLSGGSPAKNEKLSVLRKRNHCLLSDKFPERLSSRQKQTKKFKQKVDSRQTKLTPLPGDGIVPRTAACCVWRSLSALLLGSGANRGEIDGSVRTNFSPTPAKRQTPNAERSTAGPVLQLLPEISRDDGDEEDWEMTLTRYFPHGIGLGSLTLFHCPCHRGLFAVTLNPPAYRTLPRAIRECLRC